MFVKYRSLTFFTSQVWFSGAAKPRRGGMKIPAPQIVSVQSGGFLFPVKGMGKVGDRTAQAQSEGVKYLTVVEVVGVGE